MKPAKVAVIAVPAILLAAFAVQFSMSQEQPTYYPAFSDKTSISVLRLFNCGTACYDIDKADFISKYPDLEQALGQADQNYKEQGFKQVCKSNDCVNQTFSNETVTFTTDTDRGFAMSTDLENAGARMEELCIEGGYHSLHFRIGEAIYRASFDYQIKQFPAG